MYHYIVQYFIEMPVFNASGFDPDQTPRSVVSDQGLHYLHLNTGISTNMVIIKHEDTPCIGNGTVQRVKVEKSIRH